MLTIQNYVRPETLDDAWECNQSRKNRILGGMLWMRLGRGSINTAIDLCRLGLDTIEESEEEFSIGAQVTLRQLETHTGLNRYTHGAVRAAVCDIIGVQFRNMATVGGSIWGRFGFSDVLTVFLALDTAVELHRGGIIPLAQFVTMPPDRDILVRLIVRKTPGAVVYLAMRNQRTDFPTLTCAVSDLGGAPRTVIGARPGRAMIVPGLPALPVGQWSQDAISAYAEAAAAAVPTGSNVRAGAAYRSHLCSVLTARALTQLGGINGWN